MQIDADVRKQSAGVSAHLGATGERAMTALGVFGKHAVDFALALAGVVCLSPIFFVVAILIRLDSPGPVFFRQRRAGQDGKAFDIFKFRTMVDGAHKMGSRLTVKRDPRITRLGKLLRWSKVDELPQLFNVLRGEMSLIGPRPELPHFVEFYSPAQRAVLLMRPGLVGPSQILGRDEVEEYPDGLKDTEKYYIEQILPGKLARDREYVQTATFWGDMRLLVHGVWITIRGAFRARYLWRRRRRLALLLFDLLLGLSSYVAATAIRFDGDWPQADYFWQTALLIAFVRPALLVYFGVYQGITSYFGIWDLIVLFKATTVGSIAVAGLTYFIGWQTHPRSVFLIDWALLFLLLSGTRLALRMWLRGHRRLGADSRERVLIVGAGSGGAQISRALIEDPSAGYQPVGFIDESQERWGSRIHGVKVLGGTAELPLAINAMNVHTVFVCLSDLTETAVREAADICAQAEIECRMLPALSELLSTDSFAAERFGGQTRNSAALAEARSH
ncbi:MAG: sugar transferase [Deltaproteobacteria bacterium]|nr:sugar transferase [Deltaproteobacteria bacterium]